MTSLGNAISDLFAEILNLPPRVSNLEEQVRQLKSRAAVLEDVELKINERLHKLEKRRKK